MDVIPRSTVSADGKKLSLKVVVKAEEEREPAMLTSMTATFKGMILFNIYCKIPEYLELDEGAYVTSRGAESPLSWCSGPDPSASARALTMTTS